MRKIFSLLLVLMSMSSCVTLEQMTVTEFRDYTPFTERGIFVTEANNVNLDYTPLGSVVSTTRGAFQNLLSYTVDLNEAFESIAEELIKKDANGLINLNISTTYSNNVLYNGYRHGY